MFLFEDAMFYRNHQMNIVGWTGSQEENYTTELHVYEGSTEIPFSLTMASRPDVSYALYRDPRKKELGFFIQFDCKANKTYQVVSVELDENKKEVDRKSFSTSKKIITIRNTAKNVKAAINKKRKLLRHYLRKDYHQYSAWFQMMRKNPMELSKERSTVFPYMPFISIVVPVFHTPKTYLRQMLDSIMQQTYRNFELIIVNASKEDETVNEVLREYQKADERIVCISLPENLGIAENTNEGLKNAKGEFIALVDHDDMIEPDTLFEYVKRLNEKPETDLLYCDEDKIRKASDYFYYPNFKPDFNIDMLFNNNYICHMLMVRKSLAFKVGCFDKTYDGAQDYDFILKCITETRNIEHIEKVLYHWRTAETSTAKSGGNKNYAIDASVRAINACYERLHIKAKARPGVVQGWYISDYEIEGNPLVSVLIPNKDHTDDLDICIRSLVNKCSYKNLEIIVIENNSTEEKTFEYYKKIEKECPVVKVVYYEGGFNYSRINNFGFRHSTGEYIMLLNNDTEVISENVFESMLGFLQRKDVGMVGARLLYQDNTVQHAGVLAGAGGLADHYFKGEKRTKPCYMCRSITSYDVSAVTAACLMLPRHVYEEVDGLEEELAVAFNDVDFCMKVRKAGYLIVYDAQAELYHYESKSRGIENTPDKFIRFGKESVFINEKWQMLTNFRDPYYNPNMSYLSYFDPDLNQMWARERDLRENILSLSKGE